MASPTTSVCPECGWAVEADATPPAVIRKGRMLARLVVLVVLAGILIWIGSATRTTTFSLGVSGTRFVEPAVSRAALENIAAGKEPGSGLVEAVLKATAPLRPWVPGVQSIEVCFVGAAASRDESLMIGWPTPWYVRMRESSYDDAMLRTGFKPATTVPGLPRLGKYEAYSNPLRIPAGPRWMWEGLTLVHRPAPESTGGRPTTIRLYLSAIAAVLGLVIASWYIVRWVGRLVNRRNRRRWSVGGAMLATAGIVVGGVFTAKSRDRVDAPFPKLTQVGTPVRGLPVYWTREGYVRLPMDRAQVGALAELPDGDRQLASMILEAAKPAPESTFLAVASDSEVVMDPLTTMSQVSPSFFVFMLNREVFMRRPDFGQVGRVRPERGISVDWTQGMPAVRWSRGGMGSFMYSVTVNPNNVGAMIVGLWVVWIGASAVIRAFQSRMVRRRRRERRCTQCGYQVSASST